jgi:hypothetical protein
VGTDGRPPPHSLFAAALAASCATRWRRYVVNSAPRQERVTGEGDNENIALHELREVVFPGGGAVPAVCTAIGNGHFTACTPYQNADFRVADG